MILIHMLADHYQWTLFACTVAYIAVDIRRIQGRSKRH